MRLFTRCTAIAVLAFSSAQAQTSPSPDVPYLKRLAVFQTKLIKKGPAPHSVRKLELLPGVKEVTFPSGKLRLKAWVKVPPKATARKLPAIIYFHSNFAFSANLFKNTRPFTREGFVVMAPMLRAENGNPGHCEMCLGEVEDGANAVRWLSRQRIVDSSRIYTFGHSAGGIVSAMLSLHEDVPIRHGGSAAGLYGPDLFPKLKGRVPFNANDPIECAMRVLPGNTRWMLRKHYAYCPEQDASIKGGIAIARKDIAELGDDSKLQIVSIPGAHNNSQADAIARYIKVIKSKH